MRYFLALFFILSTGLSFGQPRADYTGKWKEVDQLLREQGLTRTAITRVTEIHELARRENNQVQALKALIYLAELEPRLEEQGELSAIKKLEAQLKGASAPQKQLLHSVIGSKYHVYLQMNRWRLYEFKPVEGDEEQELPGLKELKDTILYHYQQSLTVPELLKRIDLSEYDPLIIKGNARHLRPTLYDLLAHQALEYFRNEERDLHRPAYSFTIDNPAAFAPAPEFAGVNFSTADSTSPYYKSLLIFQDLLRMHMNDRDPSAFIDADLKRLEFVHQVSTLADKEDRYLHSLAGLYAKYPGNERGLMANVLRLSQLHSRALRYDTRLGDEKLRFALVEIRKELEAMQNKFPGSMANGMAMQLLNQIREKHLYATTELVNVPDKPFLALVSFRNVSKLYYRIVQWKEGGDPERYSDEKQFWQRLVNKAPLRTAEQALPDPGDHREHSTEIPIGRLKAGDYALLTSTRPDFGLEGNELSVRYFHVSRISYVNRGEHYFVLDRDNGKPLAGAEIRLLTRKYNARGVSSFTLATSRKTNVDGYAKMPVAGLSASYAVDVTWNGEKLFTRRDGYYRRYNGSRGKPAQQMTVLFTDRALYRPGQVVYFKGIRISRDPDGGRTTVIPGSASVVKLFDANGQLQDSLQRETNEFGSYSGQFRLPEGLLTGRFTLQAGDGSSVSIQVEEYKRPGFEVLFDTIRSGIALGDTLRVSGNIRSYAGNSLNDVRIRFRVSRRVILPWRYYWFRSEETEITNGETLTNGSGNFNIVFPALPDPGVPASTEPRFVFEVTVDATDLAGETRSGQKHLTIGHSSLSLSLLTEDEYPEDSLKRIRVDARNAEGLPVKIPIEISIHALAGPNRLLKQRFWSAPDLAAMPKAEFLAMFPNDPWLDEQDPANWQRSKQWFQRADSTGQVELPRALPSGHYLVEVKGRDSLGRPVSTSRIVKVRGLAQVPEYLWTSGNRQAEVGASVQLSAHTSARDPYMIRQVDRKTEEDDGDYKIVQWAKNISPTRVSVGEADRGGMGLIHFFIMHNRVHQVVDQINVPWTDKELDITVETYRDKLLPGSRETWSVNIRGRKGEKAAAELLTAMHDASLDQFMVHQWMMPSLFPGYIAVSWGGQGNFATSQGSGYSYPRAWPEWKPIEYDRFFWGESGPRLFESVLAGKAAGVRIRGAKTLDAEVQEVTTEGKAEDAVVYAAPRETQETPELRKDLAETAFFLPDLRTDAEGNVSFSFTLPESLTRWKWQMFAHSRDMAMGLAVKDIVSQKELMIQPNMPRFLRAGDRIRLSARVSNLTPAELSGMALLQLLDAETGEPADAIFQNIYPSQYFTVGAGMNKAVHFDVIVPAHYNKALRYRILARAGKHVDGEENLLPVLANRILITESLPLTVRGSGRKKFSFGSLSGSSSSGSLVHSSLTVEYSTNPTWYAVLALPYLAEYPLECSEQVFNRFYANSLASNVANSSPLIQKMFDQWAAGDSSALISQLLRNPSLRSVLIEQTPWVLQAKNETEQRRNIALLFNMNRLAGELAASIAKLRAQQVNGAFPWFKGGPEDRYITQYILTGAGKLASLNAVPAPAQRQLELVVTDALSYADRMIRRDHEQLIRSKADLTKNQLSPVQVQYLYMRSFFRQPIPDASRKAYDYYMGQAKAYWLGRNLLHQGMIAIVLHRAGAAKEAGAIIRSLKENAIVNPDLGMYWKNNTRGYYWYQSPVETQAMMIGAFNEVTADKNAVEEMKLWLLNQKRVQHWTTTTATADAIYALLRTGDSFLHADPDVTISAGGWEIKSSNVKQEAGTGYMMQRLPGDKVEAKMGEMWVEVRNVDNVRNVGWGAVHWQYLEDIDKVKQAGAPVQLSRKFYLEKNTDHGPVLAPLQEGSELAPGDKIRVRMVLKADRDMEYMHLRDMRPSGTEPLNVISRYQWKGGLGYYESTRDAWTDFFLSWLPKGSWTFEYGFVVTHPGEFSAGLATIQSMYAPEFNAHSGGSRLSFRPAGGE